MAAEWREGRWGDLVTLEYGKALRTHRMGEGPFRVFGTNGPIGWHDDPLCPHPSVVIGRKGAYRGVHYSADPFFVIDTAFYLKPIAEIDLRWAYYQLLTQDINGMDSGSAIPSTNREEFYALPVLIPPVHEQSAIAHVLGTLEDKIELNRRMNETLDAIARALFKSWFIDFDPVRAKMKGRDIRLPKSIIDLFSDSLVVSETGRKPKAWSNGSLRDVALLNPESWSVEQHPEEVTYINLANTKWGHIENMANFRWNDAPSRARRVLRRRDTVMGTVRPGNGSFAHIDEDGLTGSTGFAVLRPRDPIDRAIVWCAATSSANIERLSLLADGAAYPAVRPREIMSTPILVADYATRKAFSGLVDPLLDRVGANRRESRHLITLRDELLRVLLSGALRVDAKRLVCAEPSDVSVPT